MRRSGQASSQNRIDVIDSFRAIAILAVVLFHYTFRWGPLNPGGVDLYKFPVNVSWFEYGWLGVYLFFVISGFVIFMTVQKCRSIYDFALRRAVRLYPIYVVCMTLTFILMSVWGPEEFRTTGVDYLVGFSMQSANFGVPWVDGVYWSLLVELKFYFWIAVVYFFCPRRFVVSWSVLVVSVTLARELQPFIIDGIFSGTNLPFFTFGIGFFLLHKDGRLTGDAGLLFAVATVTYAVAWRDHPWPVHAHVAGIVALFAVLSYGKLDWLRPRPLLFIGAISYPLYLVHQYIGVTLLARISAENAAEQVGVLLIVTVAMIALAWLLHRLLEVPLHDRLHASIRRWQASRSS